MAIERHNTLVLTQQSPGAVPTALGRFHSDCPAAIARHICGRDHTTILHGVRRVAARIDAGDVETAAAVKAITAKLTGGTNG
jgi:hypothetical protein